MALSGSYDFTLDRDALITRALRTIGATGAGQTPTADEITDGGIVLNLMLKSWQADGFQLFTLAEFSVTPVESQSLYTFGPGGDIDTTTYRPEEIFQVRRRLTASTTDIILQRLAREDFYRLSNQASEGVPTQYYLDLAIASTGLNLHIWPAPNATFAADSTIEIICQKPFDDMDAATDNLAFPVSWELAIVLNLAALLAREYGLSVSDQRELREVAAVEKKRVLDWDNEKTSLFLMPSPYRGQW